VVKEKRYFAQLKTRREARPCAGDRNCWERGVGL